MNLPSNGIVQKQVPKLVRNRKAITLRTCDPRQKDCEISLPPDNHGLGKSIANLVPVIDPPAQLRHQGFNRIARFEVKMPRNYLSMR